MIDLHELDSLAGLSGAGDDAGPPVASGDWASALQAWAGARLDGGVRDLHAEARERMERALFDAALARTGGRRGEAARLLGVGRNTLGRKLGPRKPPR